MEKWKAEYIKEKLLKFIMIILKVKQMILQAEYAEDWVIATGVTTKVREFVRLAFREVGIELEFIGQGPNEKALISECNHKDFQLEIVI